MHDVYLLESAANLRTRYTGYTHDLKQRMRDHNSGKSGSTARNRPWRLVTYRAFSRKGQAPSFERYLKSGSGHAFANSRLW
jgi:putative endonuclease